MKRCVAFLLCSLSLAFAETQKETPPQPVPLDAALTAPTIWESPAETFADDHKDLGFHWVSAAHDTAQSVLKGIQLFGQPLCQSLARFEGEKLKEITCILYNRGDSGELSRPQYEALIKQSIAAISAATKTQFVPRGKDATNAVKVDGVMWTTPQTVYVLEYSCTKIPEFRSEFVRLRMTPIEKPKSLLEASFAADKKTAPFRGTDHINKDTASGDVFIKDVPMVDQGEKGYCVVATSERVLRYYGIKVDEHELAQLANSSASEGTSIRAMTETLKKLTARFKIHVKTIYETDFNGLITDYDLAARKAKEGPLNRSVSRLNELYGQMKPDVLREARAKSRGAYGSFKRHIKEEVDTGIPVLWSVMLGVIPDGSNAKMAGGHMRLIIGYNEKTDEVLYSDSWGSGHELKRISSADAWSITTVLGTVEPSGL